MKRIWAPLFLLLLLCMPILAHAQSGLPLFDPDWHIVPEANDFDADCPVGAPLGFAGVLQLIQNGMNAAISFGVLISVFVIAGAGMLWILTPTNPENHSQAKKILTSAVVGLLIILSAWLIVDFVMKLLYNPNAVGLGPWNEILTGGDYCVVAMETTPLFTGTITAVPGQGTGAGGTVTGNGGTCSIQSTGPCAATALAQYFGSEANNASKTCYGESSGNITNVSKTDIMRNDPQRRAFSFGLFQINITQHKVNGLDCPKAFIGGNYTARVRDERLYAQCVAAAKNPAINIQTAVRIRENRGSWADWSAAKKCGIAQAPSQRGLFVSFDRMLANAVSFLP